MIINRWVVSAIWLIVSIGWSFTSSQNVSQTITIWLATIIIIFHEQNYLGKIK